MKFELGESYTRAEISARLGGSLQSYLPRRAGRVVCGCFNPVDNPELPDIVLPGSGPEIEAAAAEYRKQYPVPIFLKVVTNCWRYVGNYQVASWSVDRAEIEKHQIRSGRKPRGRDRITQILKLQPVGEYWDWRTMRRARS
jgi:hypothetical protein